MLDDPNSSIVNLTKDPNDLLCSYFFKNLQFEFGAMGGKPIAYNYEKAKDAITWQGYKPKDIIPLVDVMFNSYVNNLPKK